MRDTPTTVSGIVSRALDSAQVARSTPSEQPASVAASAAQAEALAALAVAVKSAGEAVGMGLKAIADAVTRR